MDVATLQRRLKALGLDPGQVDGILGTRTYAALMARVGAQPMGEMHLDLGRAAAKHFPAAGIITPLRLAHTLAQSSVETLGFTRLVENLNYTAERIRQVWPSRFASVAAAAPYARNPQALANKVYGGRFGNTRPGDGWKFRGRGTKQTTFHDNYAALQEATGMNVLDDPDQLAEPDKGTLAGCIYWRERGCNALADADDIDALTVRVNGGRNGLPERKAALLRAKRVLL
ncbi:peptidoglycan-binding protein [Sphingomonas sp. MS122]|uniref:peptidoglycan-binding protein n=1 Tax=Sphingomonas sp. MS122 TaxID=3412683 RepID=UPI003C2EFEED